MGLQALGVAKKPPRFGLSGSTWVFKRAGEIAESMAGRNPASFRVELMNAIHNIDRFLTVKGRVRVLKQ